MLNPNTISKLQDSVKTEIVKDISNFNESLKPSTKAKSLIERTGTVSPLNFDVYSSAQRGSKSEIELFFSHIIFGMIENE